MTNKPNDTGRSADDPLADLLRLVGEDDPFASFDRPAGQAARRDSAAPSLDDGTPQDDYGYSEYEPVFANAPELRGAAAPVAHAWEDDDSSYDRDVQTHEDEPDEIEAPEPDEPAERDWHSRNDRGERRELVAAAISPDRFADPYLGRDDGGEAHEQSEMSGRGHVPPRSFAPRALVGRRSGGMVIVAAVLGLAVIGGGATLAYRAVTDTGRSGPPPVIEADADPVRLQPDEPGGAQVANQDTLIYDRVNGTPESPDDVTVTPSTAEEPLALPETEASIASLLPGGEGAAGFSETPIEPRRVRTVVVRPDGTIVQSSEPAGATDVPVPDVSAADALVPGAEPPAQEDGPPTSGMIEPTGILDVLEGSGAALPGDGATNAAPAVDGAAPANPTLGDVPLPRTRPDDVSSVSGASELRRQAAIGEEIVPAAQTVETGPVEAAPVETAQADPEPAAPAEVRPAEQPVPAPVEMTEAAQVSPAVTAFAPTQLPAAPPAAAPRSEPVAPAARAEPAEPAGEASDAAPGAWMVQLATHGSERDAGRAFNEFKARYGALLDGREAYLVKTDLGGEAGVSYRLRLAAATGAEARSLCNTIKANGGGCSAQRN